ncbi:alkaline ceramidase TOD1 [Euphorbia lathyris]|uniref:alkaline ceramidase TOD1 n=1 Tax=Euphorbia lathyris TaxID=212925 RepID=UPI003313AD1B
MAKTKISTPLLFQSKLLCISLLYLFTTLFLALYTSLHPTNCLFKSSPFDPIQIPLFSYPSTYGEHKYIIPTHRSSCSSPVHFSDYWMVLKEIQDLSRNSSQFSHELRYAKGNRKSFGGNFTIQERISYFHRLHDNVAIPCGFFKRFPVSISDQMAMESCDGVVVVSAIFNDHDKIRQPKSLGSQTLNAVCFFLFIDDVTLKGLHHHQLISTNSQNHTSIGVWRIVEVSSRNLYENPAMNGIIPKYLVHRLFPNAKFSIWIDAKLQLMVDPLLLIHALVIKEDADIAISKHPFFQHTMEEALATARWKKWWDVDALSIQMETYCENGLQPWTPQKLPYPSDVPDSALILRKHGAKSNMFSCMMFNELEAFNPRDQLPFAYVRDNIKPKIKLNMFEVEVFEQVVLEYRHNLKRSTETHTFKPKRTKRVAHDFFVNSTCCSKCTQYLLEMWGESHY